MIACRRQRGPARRAATLLEVSLAMGLLVMLSSMTYWFYSSTLSTREVETERASKLRLVRATMKRITEEIRQSSMISTGGRVGLKGDAERIWLSTVRVPTKNLLARPSYRDAPRDAQSDLVKVEYKIARHPDILHEDGYERALGLARVEIAIPRPDSAERGRAYENKRLQYGEPVDAAEEGGEEGAYYDDEFLDEDDGGDADLGPDINWEELYAPEIHFLRFCYFDGSKWWHEWDISGDNPLPQLVSVTVGLEGKPPFGEEFGTREDLEFCECMNQDPVDCERLEPDQFTAVVRIPQADPLFRSRVTRETQAVLEELGGGSQEENLP